MQSLRRAVTLSRLVLAWFIVALGVAVASPVVAPKSFELVCSAVGKVSFVDTSGESTPTAGNHTLDCPQCLVVGGPAPVSFALTNPVLPLGRVLQSTPAARLASATAAPLPARGPPSVS